MFELIGLIVAAGTAGVGYFRSRDFVAKRLRYVDAVQTASAPWIAACAATAIAAPVVWALPVIGGGTALLFGVSVGIGTRAGVKRIRTALTPGF